MEIGAPSLTDTSSDEVVKISVTAEPAAMENVESEDLRVAQEVNTSVIAPVTPVPVKEIKDTRASIAVVQCRRELVKIDVENSEECDCLCTPPKQGVFDPFAPCPVDMCLAPKLWKKDDQSRVNVARQLDFDSLSSSDEKLPESVCGGDVDVDVPNSIELDEAEKVVLESESDGFKTPEKVPCFYRTESKCPDAPMKQEKSRSKRLCVDSRLCRKLEF